MTPAAARMPGGRAAAWVGRGLVLAAAFALWLGPLELGARWWIGRYGDAMDRVRPLLNADSRLGWRQRAFLRRRFENALVVTNEAGFRDRPLSEAARARARVLVMGPSSAFGWGVAQEETYSRRLEALAEARRPGADVAVVNAGEIGYSSWQGRRLYGDAGLGRLGAKAVVLAYGVNDADRFRFFFADSRPDAEALEAPRSAAAAALENVAGRFLWLHLLERRASVLRRRYYCGSTDARTSPQARVSAAEFAANTDELAAAAARDGAYVIVMTTAYRLPPSGESAERSEELYQEAAERAAEGRCAEAFAALERARRAEPARIARDLKAYNETLRGLARRRGWPVVDAEKLLGDDARLFVDPVHPSAEGHLVLARALDEILSKRHLVD